MDRGAWWPTVHGVAKSEQLIYTSIQMVVVFLNKKEKDLAH